MLGGRPPREVLWGGRERDRQFGSRLDLYLERRARERADLARMARAMMRPLVRATFTFQDCLTPAMQNAERALRKLGRQMAAAGLFPPDGGS